MFSKRFLPISPSNQNTYLLSRVCLTSCQLIFPNYITLIAHVWRKGEVCTRFWWGNLREKGYWGDQDVDGRIILRWILDLQEVGRDYGDWLELVQDMDRWRALVSTVMNLRVVP